MKSKRSLLSVAAFAACVSFAAYAHSPIDKGHGADLGLLVDQSNLVFIGKVERVLYRNARSANTEEGPIPYTIVTYRIERVLRGKTPGQQLTMRLLGGPDGRGRFMTVTGVPTIQEGDRDLLFVANTNDASCPLVFCEMGRYRILNEQIFDTHGSPVRAIMKSKVVSRGLPPKEFQSVRFPMPAFQDLIQNSEVAQLLKSLNITAEEARSRYGAEAPKEIVLLTELAASERQDSAQGSPPPATPEEVAPIALSKFVETTMEFISRSTRPPAAEVRSIDPNAQIVPARLRMTAPKQAVAPVQPTPKSADAKEMEALVKNRFNPVLPK